MSEMLVVNEKGFFTRFFAKFFPLISLGGHLLRTKSLIRVIETGN